MNLGSSCGNWRIVVGHSLQIWSRPQLVDENLLPCRPFSCPNRQSKGTFTVCEFWKKRLFQIITTGNRLDCYRVASEWCIVMGRILCCVAKSDWRDWTPKSSPRRSSKAQMNLPLQPLTEYSKSLLWQNNCYSSMEMLGHDYSKRIVWSTLGFYTLKLRRGVLYSTCCNRKRIIRCTSEVFHGLARLKQYFIFL